MMRGKISNFLYEYPLIGKGILLEFLRNMMEKVLIYCKLSIKINFVIFVKVGERLHNKGDQRAVEV